MVHHKIRLRMDQRQASLAALLLTRYMQQVSDDEDEEMAMISAYIETTFAMASALRRAVQTPRRVWRRSHFFKMALKRDDIFVHHFRMLPATFRLVVHCSRRLQRMDTKLRDCIPLEERVSIALYFLATGDSYRVIANVFGRSRSTVCVSVREFCETLVADHAKLTVCMPQTSNECNRIMRRFCEVAGMPLCTGALGQFHVPILAPKKNPMRHRNREGWHSVVAQAVVDADCRFLDVHIGHPGSEDDRKVFMASPLYLRGEAGALVCTAALEGIADRLPVQLQSEQKVAGDFYLAGDIQYPLTDWLIKPYELQTVRPQQQYAAFNARLDRATAKVHDAFRLLKARFRCLQTCLSVDVDQVPTFVTACVILHNWCVDNNDTVRGTWLDEVDDRRQRPPASAYCHQQSEAGVALRDAMRMHCANLN